MAHYVALVGAPSTGKTAILKELEKRGYSVIKEASRQFVEKQRKIGGGLLPDVDRDGFQRALLKMQVMQMKEKEHENIVFCDTSISCGIAYYHADNLSAPVELWEAARSHQYELVLLIAPLPFYEEDGLRIESKEKAALLQEKIREVNTELGNTIIEVPFMSVADRVDFVEREIEKLGLFEIG